MIVWVASFPRSGNTFLRIVLNRLYGVRTSVVYDVDGVAGRLGPSLVGSGERPGTFAAMRASPEVHLVKTHRPRDRQILDGDKAICLVRDGRDCLVSWARQRSEDGVRCFADELRDLIFRPAERGAGSWGRNVLSWLQPAHPGRIMLRYEELIGKPGVAVRQVTDALRLGLEPATTAAIPTFAELHHVDGRFFRRGFTGTYRDELPEDLHQAFWAQPGNAAAMALLGWK
ncbi:MAG: sulfotransferase domain-containing protein [Streptosporangiaceae bacterium]